MELLKCGVPIPDIVVCSTKEDIAECKAAGLPYVVWHGSHESLIKHLLYPALVKLFPDIKWKEFLGLTGKKQILVNVPGDTGEEDWDSVPVGSHRNIGQQEDDGWSDMAESERTIKQAGFDCECQVNLDDYVGDLTAKVNVEQLAALNLLPSFMDDIATNVKRNLFNGLWTEGYNKKLGVPLGNFNAGSEAPNLLILDISHSIPLGIANTMIVLLATLRSQTNAHVIITSARSGYYAPGDELPDAKDIRRLYGRSNETPQFEDILLKHVVGKHWGNVISFGDNDTPWLDYYEARRGRKAFGDTVDCVAGNQWSDRPTIVDKVWHYHTRCKLPTGYAKWCKRLCPSCEEVFDTSWCSYMGGED